MRDWSRFDERARELDRERIDAMTAAERVEEAWRLFEELVASYSAQEREAELERRRRHRVEWLRRRFR